MARYLLMEKSVLRWCASAVLAKKATEIVCICKTACLGNLRNRSDLRRKQFLCQRQATFITIGLRGHTERSEKKAAKMRRA